MREWGEEWGSGLMSDQVNSRGPPPPPPPGIPSGIWHLRKCVVRVPFMGQKFIVKMLLDGCSIPNNAPWLPVFSHICQSSNTCAFIQIQELEHVKDTRINYFLSENPWVSGWGLTGSRWKRLKICNNSFKLGSEFPCVKMFLSDILWVGQY